MNERLPDSSGLPLRAMVMVLLFLGVVFLLVGFQAMGSGDDSGDDESSVAHHDHHDRDIRGAAARRTGQGRRAGVQHLGRPKVSAEGTANRLRDAGWNVTETGDLSLEGVTATTVYFSDAPGEREAADEVGRLLEAPVEPRLPELVEQPPGVIVAVTG